MDEKILAYTAGIIDGEGTIGLYKRTHTYGKYPVYGPHVSVTNTDPKLVHFFKTNFNGYVSINRREQKNKNWKTAYRWSISSNKGCLEFLKLVKDFLFLKKRQAETLIAYIETVKNISGRTPKLSKEKEWNRRYLFHLEMRRLNHVGPLLETTERVGSLENSDMQQSDPQINEFVETGSKNPVRLT